jgi:integrase
MERVYISSTEIPGLVLYGAATRVQPDRGGSIPIFPRTTTLFCIHHKSAARGCPAVGLRSRRQWAAQFRPRGGHQACQERDKSWRADQACKLLGVIDTSTFNGKRDFALLAVLLGCGLRRAEVVGITIGDFAQRDGHWLLPDMRGKGGHIRTVPVPGWVKTAVERWILAAKIETGPVFRAIDRSDRVWGDGIDTKVIWTIVRRRTLDCGLVHVAPHDLRRTCARLCHEAGGELDRFSFCWDTLV